MRFTGLEARIVWKASSAVGNYVKIETKEKNAKSDYLFNGQNYKTKKGKFEKFL